MLMVIVVLNSAAFSCIEVKHVEAVDLSLCCLQQNSYTDILK